MKKIILDTNFLMIPFQFKVDIFEEIKYLIKGDYQICTVDKVVEELKNLEKGKGKNSKAASFALKLLEEKSIPVLKTSDKNTDNAIIDISDENTLVATNDRRLIDRLKKKNAQIIYLRNKKYLCIK